MDSMGMKDTRHNMKSASAPKSGMNARPKLRTYRESISPASGQTPSGRAKPISNRGDGKPSK